MMSFVRCYRVCAFLPLLFVAAFAQADIEHRFSGFATLGLVSNSNSELAFRRDIFQNDGSYDGHVEWETDSLVGAQWHSRWSHQFDTTVQLVAQDRFKNSVEDSIQWAFVRYRPTDGLDLRLGRMGIDIFMLSDYRQVGYAFPWVRPPNDYYALLSLYHFDGIDLSKRFDFDGSSLNLKVFYGHTDNQYPMSFHSSEAVRLDFDLAGLSAIWEKDAWKWRYSYVNVAINNNSSAQLVTGLESVVPLWPEAARYADMARTEGRDFHYHEVGFNYDNNQWWVQGEYTQLRSQSGIIPQSDHAYLSVGRRFDQFSVFLLSGVAKPERELLDIVAPTGYPEPIATQLALLADGARRSLNGVHIDQKSYGVGVRWDFAAKMALKAQIEKFHIDTNGANLWLPTDPAGLTSDQASTVTSIALDVLF